jgi:lipopolysaccharide transport system ATP-binding protein
MSYISIQVENLSKCYRVGEAEKRHETLSAAFSSWIKSPISNYRRLRKRSRFDDQDSEDILWALKDVSFDVKDGDVVGIIGRNGAGKSTLLKIFSRITDPTAGKVIVRGKVSSLLEVGTGFHQELTGRENVYLNGTILGMSKKEIDKKFDEIVAFSEVEKFIDTPVKHYSSGMKVRLAFSVAAHLDPDILIVDEVLAVGDISFQKKCLGKMEDVSTRGRTVLFVSHNLHAIRQLCKRCLVLDNGQVKIDGDVDRSIDFYHEFLSSHQTGDISEEMHRFSDGARFIRARIYSTDGTVVAAPKNNTPFRIEFDLEITQRRLSSMMLIVGFDTVDGVQLTRITTDEYSLPDGSLKFGINRIQLEVELPYSPGLYSLILRLDQTEPVTRPLALVRNAMTFELQESGQISTKPLPKSRQLIPLKGKWFVENVSEMDFSLTNKESIG